MRRLVLAALLLALPGHARADVDGDVGLGARASALGNAVGAVGGDPMATVYNPGALVLPGDRAGVGELSVDALVAAPHLFATTLEGVPLTTVAPRSTYGFALGARFDIGNAFGAPGLVLGLALYAPFDGLVGSAIHPDDTPQWLMYTDRMQHITIYAALAYRIAEWLSVGVGARVIFDEETFITGMATGIRRETDPATGEERIVAGARLGVRTAIYGHASPTLGVLVTPHPMVRFGLAYRAELFSDDWGASRLTGLDSVGELGFLHRFVHVYRPHELSWSASFRPVDALELSAELTWAMWSMAASPNRALLEGRFGDVLVPAAGVRVRVHPGVDLLAGYRFQRRPFDDFGGPTNLLTADTHAASLGVELDLDALVDEPVPFTLTLAGRLAVLEEREEVKNGRRFADDRALVTNPGYPGYRYGGVVPSVQLGVRARW